MRSSTGLSVLVEQLQLTQLLHTIPRSPSELRARRWRERRQNAGRRKEEDCAVRFRSESALWGNESAKREPEIQFRVQRGGIKLAFPDALTEAHLRRTERRLSMRKVTHAA